MKLDAAVFCHAGRVRQNNEDNFNLAGQIRQDLTCMETKRQWLGNDRRALFAVADGMGGEENGELASLVTVQNLNPCGIREVRETAAADIRRANELICDEIRSSRCRGMGSTLAALYIDSGKAVCCNVGDSRAYLLRGGELRQLSVDHTKVQQMVDMGILTKEQARTHRSRYILSQNIGIFEEEMIIEPEFSEEISLEPGDVFLLCSDGLTDMVEDPQILWALTTGIPEEQAQTLVSLALEHGGKDNVTVLVVQVRKASILDFFIR